MTWRRFNTVLIFAFVASVAEAAVSESAAMVSGKDAYRRADFKGAVQSFEKAATAEPRNSDVQLWLGRAYGRLAETSSFLNAPRYASRCRQAFERSVENDPKNLEAWNDLFSYYLDAPGFLGGGWDKAQAAAARISELDQAEGAFARSRLAEEHKDFVGAESELRRAIELAPGAVGRLVDLGVFLAKRGKRAPSDVAFAQAAAIDPKNPSYLFQRAKVLITEKREPDEARRLLELYMHSKLNLDDPTPAEAQRLLAQISKPK